MTQVSVKIGRFMCDSATDVHRRIHFRSKHHKVMVFHDDVLSGACPSRVNSTGNLKGFNGVSRKLSLPNFYSCGWESGAQEEQLLEMERERQMMEYDVKDRTEDYNRTLLPHENDRMTKLFRAFHLNEGGKDEWDSIDEEADDDGKQEEEEEAVDAALPWRSKEQMDVLEDTSKYLRRDDDLATPRVNDLALDDDAEGPRLDPLPRSSSLSSSSSFRNAPLPSGQGVTRPDLSNCQSLSLSHWLSEAESRHSEPFGLQHHHVVLDAASMAEPSIRSSVDRRLGRQWADCCPAAPRDHHSSSEGVSTSLGVTATDDDEWTLSRHEQVLHWLMSNDLAEELDEEEEEEEEQKDKVNGHDLCSCDPSAREAVNVWPD